MIKRAGLFFLLIVISLLCVAQENIPLNRDIVFTLDKYVNRKDSKVFTALKPYNRAYVDPLVNIDSALTPGCKKAKEHERWIKRKLFREDLFVVNSDDFHLDVDPLFDFSYGRSLGENKSLYTNTRGVQLKGTFGKKIFFITSYYETQARFPDYVTAFATKYEVAPGQGRVKNFKKDAFDFGTPAALVSYSPNKHLNFQFGYDKNFIGDGYRSLLLSDNAYQSPFLKVFLNYGWFYYQTIFTSFQNMNTDSVLNAPYIWYHGYQTKPAPLIMQVSGSGNRWRWDCSKVLSSKLPQKIKNLISTASTPLSWSTPYCILYRERTTRCWGSQQNTNLSTPSIFTGSSCSTI